MQKQFRLEEDDTILHSLANGRKFYIGKFSTPSVDDLNDQLTNLVEHAETSYNEDDEKCALEFEHILGDVKSLHHDPQNQGAVFQVASQFNCLEMPHSQVKPDSGITQYDNDHTQGPTCAVACSAGTIYRNYFVNTHGQGGKKGKQIDCLAECGEVLGNEKETFWKMQNGYALPTDHKSIAKLRRKIYAQFLMSREAMSKIRVGVQWNTEVVKEQIRPNQGHHCVTQVYCSAVPISYATNSKMRDFEPFAKLILDAAYHATFAVAAIKALESKKRIDLFLTKVGGGMFGNRSRWVVESIRKNLRKFEDFPLNVYLVHHGTLEQSYFQGLKSSKKVEATRLITDYFASNITVSKSISSPDTTVCSNDDSTALLMARSNSPNDSDESIQTSACSTTEVRTRKKINNSDELLVRESDNPSNIEEKQELEKDKGQNNSNNNNEEEEDNQGNRKKNHEEEDDETEGIINKDCVANECSTS